MNNTVEHVDQLLVVIVLYNASLSDSESYESIAEGFRPFATNNQRVDLMVVNNGPLPIDRPVDEEVFRLHFVEQLDNPGVSKAYNMAGKLANRLQKTWLLLLDQDTRLPPDFWSRYNQSLNCYPAVPIHAPKLYAGGVLVSPCAYRYYRGHLLNGITSGANPVQGRNVLNSGLLVNVEAFQRVGGYDESVQLYFSDFVFFNRIKRVCDTFAVVDVDLLHDLSSSDYSSEPTAMNRFLLYCQGAYAAAKGGQIRSILYFLTVGARSLVMGRRFSTWAFTRVFLRTWFE